MYSNYEFEDEIYDGELLYEQGERTSDIQLPPVINALLFAIWIVICLIGFAVIFLANDLDRDLPDRVRRHLPGEECRRRCGDNSGPHVRRHGH
jgi:hypothetical protein